MGKKKAFGFGYIPEESKHHFLLVTPKSPNQDVAVYERFEWDESEEQVSGIVEQNLKVTLDRHKWNLLKDALTTAYNNRLKDRNITVGKFKIGQVPVERLLGKEMVLLMWAIEDSDPKLIPTAIRNWLGLSREERWWLFTMTNAVTGHADDKRGWRKAIRYALTENPVDDDTRGNILEMLYRNV
ncbi:DUF3780 domain-containing protein [Bacillus sp. ISL-4]|uniref:DUF3780 domain-containing protein n=1 Tax=Bacillus sp. ISL-4 TaxID=2819125 RepID=UPI001BE5B245|nr:DUF3780 domain-containing protein [Bacillus sp. ISL-4]MBT2667306.1 DUF3780 domain-containing protein [Bacillus sp. ISL-4]MBT2674182.1 DUF3780 domain-containing protein [Streptomyces sp. ISL-14]